MGSDWWEESWHTAVKTDKIVQRSRIEEQGPNYLLLDPCLLCGRDWGRKGGGMRVKGDAMGRCKIQAGV